MKESASDRNFSEAKPLTMPFACGFAVQKKTSEEEELRSGGALVANVRRWLEFSSKLKVGAWCYLLRHRFERV